MYRKIPLIIHQIWFQGGKSSNKYEKFSKKWKKYHPDWKYIRWDKKMIENLIQKSYPRLLSDYQNLSNMISQIDFGKYVILYHYGGIYIDMDSEPLDKLHDLINTSYPVIVSHGIDNIQIKISKISKIIPNQFINNAFIATVKNHILFKHLLNNVIPQRIMNIPFYLTPNLTVLYTVGPYAFSEAIADIIKIHPQDIKILDTGIVESDDSTILPKLIRHHNDKSWASFFTLHLEKFGGTYQIIIAILSIIIIFIIIKNFIYKLSRKKSKHIPKYVS